MTDPERIPFVPLATRVEHWLKHRDDEAERPEPVVLAFVRDDDPLAAYRRLDGALRRGPLPMCVPAEDGGHETVMVTDMKAWLEVPAPGLTRNRSGGTPNR